MKSIAHCVQRRSDLCFLCDKAKNLFTGSLEENPPWNNKCVPFYVTPEPT
uniref:Uncharacterized protein n=1 Tax=Anguilla anguilla TaxID=7936 RepID=A0A0E9VDM0_ANGAN